jgi:ATP-dependent exoDNAse (exonuclease V) beta subunit
MAMSEPAAVQATLPLGAEYEPQTVKAHEPTTEQALAISSRGRDVLLQAGAGTGKTRVLVERYCDAVTEDEIGIEAILAFTFTERAGAELRSRIRRELTARARAARVEGDLARATQLFDAARATESAWVTTIHGFCRRLLASHPAAAGLDPRFRVLDESEATRLRERCAREAITGIVEDDPDGAGRVVAAYGAWRIGKITLAAYERLRSQGMDDPRLPAVGDPVRSRRRDEEAAEPLTPAEIAAAQAARGALEGVLEAFTRRYEGAKSARSGLDFADLELRAVALLRDSEQVAATWRGRFEHLMVDEFQDTSRIQLELVQLLRGPQTRVFEVGDEFQSIYRFRNADLEVFRAERRAVEADPARDVRSLTGNFRSLPPVLGAVNGLGEALFDSFVPLTSGRPPAAKAPDVELLLTPSRRGRAPETWQAHAKPLDMPASESSAATVAEARFLARRLRALVESGGADRGDIVVLLRAFTHVDAFEEALGRAGLDPYVLGGRGYWSQQQVEDILRLLACVSNPLDDEPLFGALASPACAVSPDALWLLRRAAGAGSHVWPLVEWRFGGGEREPDRLDEEWERWIGAIDAEDAAKLRRFCERLAALRAEAPLRPLDSLVERTMDTFAYDLALLALDGGGGRMANARKLMRLARAFEENEGRDLAAFLVAAEESTRRDEREGMAPVQAEGYDGVRIMTVHAAKGLEFPVVAVADMGRALNAGHRWEDLFVSRPEPDGEARFGMRLAFPAGDPVGLWELHELGDEENVEAAEEGARLVYVAATRARDRLILSGAYAEGHLEPCEKPAPGDTPLRRFLPALCERGWKGGDETVALPPPPPAGGGEEAEPTRVSVRLNPPSEKAAVELARREARTVRTEELPTGRPPLRVAAGAPAPVGHLSYSALAGYERCGYRFYAERVLRLGAPLTQAGAEETADEEDPDEGVPGEVVEPPPSASDADGVARAPLSALERRLALGNAVHVALERSALEAWQRPGDAELHALVASEGLAGDDEAEAEARRLVDAWLDSELRGRLDGMRLRPEVPFVLAVAGTVVRGKIDLLATAPDRPPVVIDFKTDALRGRGPALIARRYAAQQEVYALAAGTAAEPEGQAALTTVHLFLEAPERPVEREFDPAGLAAARGRLEEIIARMRAGEFAPTASPDGPTCFGCPAAARLCPHPAWRPPSGG